MLPFSALAIGLLTRFAPLSTPLTRCGAPCMLYDRGQDSGAEMDEEKVTGFPIQWLASDYFTIASWWLRGRRGGTGRAEAASPWARSWGVVCLIFS